MLVLSRKVQEQICLPELDVVITVLDVRGGKVRLGITAPDGIAIFREELWEQLQQDSANAVGSRSHDEESVLAREGSRWALRKIGNLQTQSE